MKTFVVTSLGSPRINQPGSVADHHLWLFDGIYIEEYVTHDEDSRQSQECAWIYSFVSF